MKADIKKIILLTAVTALIIITAGCISNPDDGNQNNPAESTSVPVPATQLPQTVPPTPDVSSELKNKSSFSVILSENYPYNVSAFMKSAKRMNKVAGEDEYSYLLNLWITCKSIGSGDSFEFDPYEDVFLSVDGVNYKAKSKTTYPEYYPEIQSASLREGESVSGWLYFILPAGFAKLNMNSDTTESNVVDLIYR